ncbi:MAG: hypothetical protein ACXABD_21680 [Candidatus Thorarchaeota archaeon]|jgi:hypothetical protein
MALPVRPIETTDTKELKWGHTVVGTTAVKLTALEFKFEKGLLLRAPGSSDPTPNANFIWIGGAGVTADSNAGTGGMPLAPGESINLPVDDPTEVYVISDAASQDIAWMGV